MSKPGKRTSKPSSKELERLEVELQAIEKESNGNGLKDKWPYRHAPNMRPQEQLTLFRELQPYVQGSYDDPSSRFIPRELVEGWRLLHVLTATNTRLVYFFVRRKFPHLRGHAFSDACQEAMILLQRGVLAFDPSRGTAPSTYLGWWIRSVGTKFRKFERAIRLPEYVFQQRRRDGEPLNDVLFYEDIAHTTEIDDIQQTGIFHDTETVSPENRVIVGQIFGQERAKLRLAADLLKERDPVRYLLFTLDTGYDRGLKGPVRLKVLARWSGLTKDEVESRVERIVRDIGRMCGYPKYKDARRFIDAMVEYSLHLGIPL